jgi:hypothetical protein
MKMPSDVQESIWRAVEEAVNYGVSPKEFRQEAAECWVEKCRQDAQHATKVLRGEL